MNRGVTPIVYADGCIDGTWKSGDFLVHLRDSIDKGFYTIRSRDDYSKIHYIGAIMEVVVKPVFEEQIVRPVEGLFVSVMPRRDFRIYIEFLPVRGSIEVNARQLSGGKALGY